MSNPNTSFKRSIARLKEFSQFGPGETFTDKMRAFEATGEDLTDVWPWIPFDPSGNLLCSYLPHPKDCNFELILVQTLEPVRFPVDDTLGYRVEGIEQHITIIDGTLDLLKPGSKKRHFSGDEAIIQRNDLVALGYGKGIFLFKQIPRIAHADDFTFEHF